MNNLSIAEDQYNAVIDNFVERLTDIATTPGYGWTASVTRVIRTIENKDLVRKADLVHRDIQGALAAACQDRRLTHEQTVTVFSLLIYGKADHE